MKLAWRREKHPEMHFLKLRFDPGFCGDSVVKNPPANAGDMCLTPGPGRSSGDASDEAPVKAVLSPG